MTVLSLLLAPRRSRGRDVRRPALAMTPLVTGLVLAAAVLVLDQATKALAERLLVPGRLVPLLGNDVGWQLTYNAEGPLGLSPAPLANRLAGPTVGAVVGEWFFVVVTLLVTVVVLRGLSRARRLRAGVADGLLLAGAWGNGLDRGLRPPGLPSGEVVDFLAIGSLPRFNVADVAIVVGFVALLAGRRRDQVLEER